jgi:cysteine-rich repeat protein
MTRHSNVTALIASTLFVTALLSAGAPEAFAQISKERQSCINALNKAGAKVAATQGKENSGCIKAGGSENLDVATVDLCVEADAKQKVSGARQKTQDAQDAKCTVPPTFGFSGFLDTNDAAENEEKALVHAVFGDPIHPNILTDTDGAKCQAAVAKSLEKLAATRMKTFNGCKKTRLKDGTATSASQLIPCFDEDLKQKVDGAATKLDEAVAGQCPNTVSLAAAFPGCSSQAGNAGLMSACIERLVECKMCLMTNAMDELSIPCDLTDDGTVNQTCRQCGNNLQEAPEPCDTAGDSASCDFDCTVPSCGDSHTNTAAGEACDDGNGVNTDVCVACQIATCGDGATCSGVGCTSGPGGGVEACDDGDNINGNGCDNNCSVSACGNGISAGVEQCDDGNNVDTDSCRNSCLLATCGDGVTCVGPSCTSGPTGGAEACDDADVSNNDSCLNNCALASCGDGFECNEGGCTSGPTGGLEQCDNAGANSDVVVDACRTNCADASCGDGVTDTGEACDDDNASNADACLTTCVVATCGDGFTCSAMGCTSGPTGGAEDCDDSNGSNTDACLTNCDAASCGDGFLCNTMGCTTGPSGGLELCDNAGANSNVTPDACRLTCAPAGCPDNVVDTGEACDTGGNSMTCDANCTAPACGDGFVNPAFNEDCDTSGESVSCDADCTDAICGDLTINATKGENCEDGNDDSGDGCSSECTTGPGSGEQQPQCPNLGELTLYSKNSNIACTSNMDCDEPRFCNTGLAAPRCETVADLDSGWNGAGHNSDINDQVTTAATLLCESAPSPGCGVCQVTGLDPSSGNCRCANDILIKCDEPLQADVDDCGGNECNCYFGAPFPLSALGTPVCVSNKFSADISGTANPDLGAGEITANLRAQVFLGYTLDLPCPVCGGKCSDDQSGCIFDSDCTGNADCVQDIPGDNIRGGLCIRDPDFHTGSGEACDINGVNANFPAVIGVVPGGGGGGYSIDCQPDAGKNAAGAGLRIELTQTTGLSSLGSDVDCNGPTAGTTECPCLVCSTSQTEPCDSNADCALLAGSCSGAPQGGGIQCTSDAQCTGVDIGPCNNLGRCTLKTSQMCGNNGDCQNQNVAPCALQTCTAKGTGITPKPNNCTDTICTDLGGGEGTCMAGPNYSFCDAIVKSDGESAAGCLNNGDCSENGYGLCTIQKLASCFLDPIVAQGIPDPVFPIAAATFCVPPASNSAVNNSAGLPGPGRVVSQGAARTFCASNNAVQYNPGGLPACP